MCCSHGARCWHFSTVWWRGGYILPFGTNKKDAPPFLWNPPFPNITVHHHGLASLPSSAQSAVVYRAIRQQHNAIILTVTGTPLTVQNINNIVNECEDWCSRPCHISSGVQGVCTVIPARATFDIHGCTRAHPATLPTMDCGRADCGACGHTLWTKLRELAYVRSQ